jgi:hypothetical protein
MARDMRGIESLSMSWRLIIKLKMVPDMINRIG